MATGGDSLEQAANDIELAGGAAQWADSLRRVALEQARADGKREAFAEVLMTIDRETAGNYIYQRAGKRIAIAVTRLLRAVNASLT